jgi:hypothetical protein
MCGVINDINDINVEMKGAINQICNWFAILGDII